MTITIHAPQAILLFLLVLGLVLHIAKHGQERSNPRYHAGYVLIDFLITVGLLYWGGFFSSP